MRREMSSDKKNMLKNNHLGGGDSELGIKRFVFSMVSGSSPVVAHMMATGGLHGR
jgi:hypothetical protein